MTLVNTGEGADQELARIILSLGKRFPTAMPRMASPVTGMEILRTEGEKTLLR
jgi:hypothetical protein